MKNSFLSLLVLAVFALLFMTSCGGDPLAGAASKKCDCYKEAQDLKKDYANFVIKNYEEIEDEDDDTMDDLKDLEEEVEEAHDDADECFDDWLNENEGIEFYVEEARGSSDLTAAVFKQCPELIFSR